MRSDARIAHGLKRKYFSLTKWMVEEQHSFLSYVRVGVQKSSALIPCSAFNQRGTPADCDKRCWSVLKRLWINEYKMLPKMLQKFTAVLPIHLIQLWFEFRLFEIFSNGSIHYREFSDSSRQSSRAAGSRLNVTLTSSEWQSSTIIQTPN